MFFKIVVNILRVVKNKLYYKQTPIEHPRRLLLYSPRTFSLLAMKILILVLKDSVYLQLIYFLNTIPFWFAERIFLVDGTLTIANYFQSVTEFTLRFLYRLNQPLWKIQAIA